MLFDSPSPKPRRAFTARRLALCLAAAVLASACADAPETRPAAQTVTDDLGREVELSLPVARVAPLAPSLTEMAAAAGAAHRLVGVTSADDYPAWTDSLPRYDVLPVDFERIAGLRPDLVLATDVNSPRDAETLAGLGTPTVFLTIDSLADVERTLRTLGRLMGTQATASARADSLERLRMRWTARETGERPTVLFLIGEGPLYAWGEGAYVHEMLALAGGRSATAQIGTASPVLSEEWVIGAAPEVIIGAWGADYDPARLDSLHPSWTSVPAVRDGRVYGIDPDHVLRPGPRLWLGIDAMAAAIADTSRGGRR